MDIVRRKLMFGHSWGKRVKVMSIQGPRSKFSSGGAKEECVKENF